ncbi:hypothetical protein MW887_005558 [Aspergillus wentii]|nr:hypothetical protein MW887_005558 [Aspergillus wentii]
MVDLPLLYASFTMDASMLPPFMTVLTEIERISPSDNLSRGKPVNTSLRLMVCRKPRWNLNETQVS